MGAPLVLSLRPKDYLCLHRAISTRVDREIVKLQSTTFERLGWGKMDGEVLEGGSL